MKIYFFKFKNIIQSFWGLKLTICLSARRLARRLLDCHVHLVAEDDEDDVWKDLQKNKTSPGVNIRTYYLSFVESLVMVF